MKMLEMVRLNSSSLVMATSHLHARNRWPLKRSCHLSSHHHVNRLQASGICNVIVLGVYVVHVSI